MAEHTRGPWKWKSDKNGVRVGAEPDLMIAELSVQADETEANARLIAAAPDLLKAGMFIRRALRTDYVDHLEGKAREYLADAMMMICEATDKARGEE